MFCQRVSPHGRSRSRSRSTVGVGAGVVVVVVVVGGGLSVLRCLGLTAEAAGCRKATPLQKPYTVRFRYLAPSE